MDQTFIYSQSVSGRHFVGRRSDVNLLSNLLAQQENVALYGPPKCGKTSLLQQAFMQMKVATIDFSTTEVPMMGVRTREDFVRRFGAAVLRVFAGTPGEFNDLAAAWLKGTHLVFDSREYADKGEIISFNWDIDDDDVTAILRLPYLLAADRGVKLFILLKEWQCILEVPGHERILKRMEAVIKEQRSGLIPPQSSFIFSGSALNAMKYIFEQKRWFWRMCERVSPTPLEEKEIIEHITRRLMTSGKVVEGDLLVGLCKLLRCDIWYINHFMAICDHMSKGYIMEPMMVDALDCLTAIHEQRFKAVMSDLTTFQLSLLKAILDGHTRFSAADVISGYGLNSSANVKRLKDALIKKEIVTFDDKDEPVVIDPLFEYWARKFFFGEKLGL